MDYVVAHTLIILELGRLALPEVADRLLSALTGTELQILLFNPKRCTRCSCKMAEDNLLV